MYKRGWLREPAQEIVQGARSLLALCHTRLRSSWPNLTDPEEETMTSTHKEEFAQTLDQAMALTREGQLEARQSIDRSVEGSDRNAADIHYEYLWKLRTLEAALEAAPVPSADTMPTYVVGALFLERCRAALTRDEKEAMFYVSGLERDGCIYLTDILTFDMSRRSVGGVHGDEQSVFQAVMKLRQAGQALYAWFHSHPGSRNACSPSSIDMTTQQRLEGLNYPVVGAIFTRDGYLRFFSADRQFQVQIHGKGVSDVDPEKSLYKIELSG